MKARKGVRNLSFSLIVQDDNLCSDGDDEVHRTKREMNRMGVRKEDIRQV